MNNYRIDNLQYCNWSKEIFQINNEAKLDAVHVTIAYHEYFNEVKKNVQTWSKHFQDYKNLIFHDFFTIFHCRIVRLTTHNYRDFRFVCFNFHLYALISKN